MDIQNRENFIYPMKNRLSRKDIGRIIRRHRIEAGLTQMQLAEKLGITYQQVQKYETGKSSITVERLYQIADALDVSVQDILSDTEEYFKIAEEREHYCMDTKERKIVKLLKIISNRAITDAVLKMLEEIARIK